MVVMFSDFGLEGPYIGQVEGALYQSSPAVRFINLLADAPRCDPFLAGFLLAACSRPLPESAILLCVVDPGVGTAGREPVVVEAGGRCFVGPDNGLFDVVANLSADAVTRRTILWRPESLSASFHGRDLFAPIAARLAVERELPPSHLSPSEPYLARHQLRDIRRIIYMDGFGNAVSGIRAATLNGDEVISLKGRAVKSAGTFGEVGVGEAFWYENSMGLVEIAVNKGSARRMFDLMLGDELFIGA